MDPPADHAARTGNAREPAGAGQAPLPDASAAPERRQPERVMPSTGRTGSRAEPARPRIQSFRVAFAGIPPAGSRARRRSRASTVSGVRGEMRPARISSTVRNAALSTSSG